MRQSRLESGELHSLKKFAFQSPYSSNRCPCSRRPPTLPGGSRRWTAWRVPALLQFAGPMAQRNTRYLIQILPAASHRYAPIAEYLNRCRISILSDHRRRTLRHRHWWSSRLTKIREGDRLRSTAWLEIGWL